MTCDTNSEMNRYVNVGIGLNTIVYHYRNIYVIQTIPKMQVMKTKEKNE
jgi:hypothetical protein